MNTNDAFYKKMKEGLVIGFITGLFGGIIGIAAELALVGTEDYTAPPGLIAMLVIAQILGIVFKAALAGAASGILLGWGLWIFSQRESD